MLHEGHLYGFTGRFLTCAAVDSGEIVWRSRPPGALGISLVGDKLAVIAQSGDLVLADASPEGYREITRIATFERGDYATPTFVDDHFLVRNLERLAAVRVDTSATPRHAEVEVDPTGHLLGELKSGLSRRSSCPSRRARRRSTRALRASKPLRSSRTEASPTSSGAAKPKTSVSTARRLRRATTTPSTASPAPISTSAAPSWTPLLSTPTP